MNYLASKTTVPVPGILHISTQSDHALGMYMLLEKIPGIKLSTIFSTLEVTRQDLLVTQIAKWTIELFKHRFAAVGSLYSSHSASASPQELEYHVGAVSRPPFYVDGRDKLQIDRGPFSTARAYFIACAQREIDCARTQSTQDTSDMYQRDVEAARFTVERTMALMFKAIEGCKGLDDEDPELKEFSLSLVDLDLSKIYVSPEEPSKIVSLPFWYAISTRPLWHCARLPSWLTISLCEGSEDSFDKERLEIVFRKAIEDIDGANSVFLNALDLEDTRRTIDDLCDYDAFSDGFLLLPTLESLIATLPGEEDHVGLQALLDPNTLEGRAARIALLTKGSGPLSLATQGDLAFERDINNGNSKDTLRPVMPRMGSGCLLMT